MVIGLVPVIVVACVVLAAMNKISWLACLVISLLAIVLLGGPVVVSR